MLADRSPSTAEQSADSATLTNKDILELVHAGLSAEVIVAKINGSRCDFSTSPDSLKALKAANVPDAVILAMVKSPSAAASSSGPSSQPEPVVRMAKVSCVSFSEVPLLREPGSSRLVKQVKCGSDIAVLAEQGAYFKVRTSEGETGFISDVFVSKRVAPVVSDPSLRNSPAPNTIHAIAWRAVPG